MIKATIIGHIGTPATEKKGMDGDSYFTFSVAASNKKDAQPLWVTVFTKQAKLAPYLTKGTQVYIDGNLELKLYTNKQGQEVIGASINNPTIQLIGGKKDGNATSSSGYQSNSEPEDLPF